MLFLFSCSPSPLNGGSGISQNAPEVVFYAATGEECCGEDPHPVHGAQTADGGFVLCGKSIDSGGNSDGFLLKVGADVPQGKAVHKEGGGRGAPRSLRKHQKTMETQ